LGFLGVKSIDALRRAVGQSGHLADEAAAKLVARLADWEKLLEGLGAMGLANFVAVDLGVVRGLAYYTGFVFEAFDRKGTLRALAGGGRYDDLVAKLGGPPLPAAGFAIGDMTFSLLLEERGLTPVVTQAPDVICVLGGPAERLAAFADIHALRTAGYRVEYPFKDASFGKQFKAAAESGAKLALIYGADELAKGVVRIRDLVERTERDVPRGQVAAAVRDSFTR
jgi:histidyl-tRNA synthetase